jgi:hypothetical protein
MGRLRTAAVAGGIVAACIAPGVARAAASQSVLRDQREADALASMIRSDARRGGPSATTLIRTRKDCCGLRFVEVYYRAHRRAAGTTGHARATHLAGPAEGAYHLPLLETATGSPIAITLHEYGTEPGYVLGTEPSTHASHLSYTFSIEKYRVPPKYLPQEERLGWSVLVSYSYSTLGMARRGASSAELRQAIEVTDRAALRAPVTGETSDIPS